MRINHSYSNIIPSLRVILLIWMILIAISYPSWASDYSQDEVCLLCHPEDKLVNSNGCKKWQRHGHPVGVIPSSRVHIPDRYPLNDRGRMTCGTCHLAKIYKLDSETEVSGLPLRVENENSYMCKQCHFRQMRAPEDQRDESRGYDMLIEDLYQEEVKSELKGKSSLYNHPVGVKMSRFPKQILWAGGKMGAVKDELICESCHAVHRAKTDQLLVMENSRGELCGICHAPMYGENREQTSKKGTHPINIVPSAGVLNQMLAFKGGRKRGKENQLLCSTCHLVHGAPVQKNLLVSTNQNDILCKNCHQSIFKNLTGTKHDIQQSLPDLENVHGQLAAEGGKCSPCHLVHRGNGAGMWALTTPRKIMNDPVKMLCESCHYQDRSAANVQVGQHSHPTSVPLSSADSTYTALPGYSKQGNRTAGGLVTCATCHDVHRWSPDSDEKGKNAGAGPGNSFLRKSNYKSSLCFECHITPSYIANTSHDLTRDIYQDPARPVPKIISKKKIPPIEERGACDYCHGVHNAVGVKLWIRQLGPGKNKITQICSSCHSRGMIAGRKQTGKISHSVGVSILKLGSDAGTDLPLFNEELAKDPQGLVMCNSCHDIHRWDPKLGKIVKPPGEGNSNNSFLRLSANDPKSPLCENCHSETAWIRNTSHDLRLSAPKSKNLLGRIPSQTGLCGSCHGVHNGLTKFVLWNYTFGPGDDLISKICNGCHSAGKMAGSKLIGKHSHLVNVSTFKVLDDLEETSLYIYDSKYKRLNSPENRQNRLASLERSLERSKGKEFYKDNPEVTKRFRNLKGLYLEFREEMAVEKERIMAELDQKEKLRDQIMETEKRAKQLREKAALANRRMETLTEKSQKYQEERDRKEQTLQRETKRQYEEELKKQLLGGRYNRSPSLRKRPVRSRNQPFVTSKKRVDLKKTREEFISARKSEEKVKKELKELNENYEKDTKELTEKKADLAHFQDELKLAAEKLLSLSRSYHTIKRKTSELKERIISLNPRAFKFVKASVQEETLFLKPNNEPDYRKSYFSLMEKNLGTKNRWKRLVRRSRKVRNKFLKLIINPSGIYDISDFELDGILDGDLRDEVQKDLLTKPQGKVLCSSCHNVHKWNPDKNEFGKGKTKGNKNNSFLRTANKDGYKLCVQCHQDKGYVVGTDHDLRITATEETNHLGQSPRESGVCGVCHLSHNAGESFALWSKKSPFKDKLQELEEAEERLRKARREIKTRSTEIKEMKTKLSRRRPKRSKRSITRLKKKLLSLKGKLKKLKKDKKLSVSQKKFIGRSYQTQIDSLTRIFNKLGIVVSPKKKKEDQFNLKRYKTLQAEVNGLKQEVEALTVKVKTAQRERKLSGGWNIFNVLCKSCHDDDKSAWSKTVGFKSHPVNIKSRYFLETLGETGGLESEESAEKEENTEIPENLSQELDKLELLSSYPLFTEDGKRNFKSGKLYCPTCHNVHQWDPRKFEPGLGKDEEGNATNSFLRLPNAPEPQLCLNCHFKTGRVVGTKHDLRLTAPDARNFRGDTIEQAGVCSACHVVHNSYDRYMLWAREFGPSYLPGWLEGYRIKDNRPVQICTSCHTKDGWAPEKVPEAGLHYYSPLYYLKEVATVLKNPQFPYFKYNYREKTTIMGVREILAGAAPKYPVYLPSGKLSPKGNIACTTCHNPHQWSAGSDEKKGEGLEEGNISNSFLKSGIAEHFCADCHREKALYDFTFYHQDRMRLRKNRLVSRKNPHWRKESMNLTACTDCHKEKFLRIHQPGTFVDRVKRTLSEKIPLGEDNTIQCITCHDLNRQTVFQARERNRNRYFLRDWYQVSYQDAIVMAAAKEYTRAGDLVIGGPPTQMMDHLGKGIMNQADLEKAKTEQLQGETGWIKSSLFTQYNLCFNCHNKSDYPAFNPHIYQILPDGRINKENCALCHYRIPNRRRHQVREKNYFLRAKMEFYCLGCHPGNKRDHPGKNTHFGLIMTQKLMDNLRKKEMESSLPLKDGKILCSSCHDTHETGVLKFRKSGRSKNLNWLRFSGKNVCTVCHIKVSDLAPDMAGSPF